jgi:hypothetical protein
MNIVIKELSQNKTIFVPLSDLHVGHVDCDIDYIKKTVAWMVSHNAYTVLLGDMIDAICRHDKRYENDSIDPYFLPYLDNLHHEQESVCCELLQPLADHGLIIGMLTGNHETTIKKYFSHDSHSIMSEKLGIPIITDPGYVVLKFNIGGSILRTVVWCSHGCFMPCGRTKGAQVVALERQTQHFDADIYLAGHTHNKWVFPLAHRIGVNSKNRLIEKRRTGANTGGFMRTYSEKNTDTWASRKCFPPQVPGVVRFDIKIKTCRGNRYVDIHGSA